MTKILPNDTIVDTREWYVLSVEFDKVLCSRAPGLNGERCTIPLENVALVRHANRVPQDHTARGMIVRHAESYHQDIAEVVGTYTDYEAEPARIYGILRGLNYVPQGDGFSRGPIYVWPLDDPNLILHDGEVT